MKFFLQLLLAVLVNAVVGLVMRDTGIDKDFHYVIGKIVMGSFCWFLISVTTSSSQGDTDGKEQDR